MSFAFVKNFANYAICLISTTYKSAINCKSMPLCPNKKIFYSKTIISLMLILALGLFCQN